MKMEKARDKFGEEQRNDIGKKVWVVNMNKIRGLLMKFARARRIVYTRHGSHNAKGYVDQFWNWGRRVLGEGFNGIFFAGGASPSGAFDRVTKEELWETANALYDNNEDYRSRMDSIMLFAPDKYRVPADNLCWCAEVDAMPRKDVIEFFRVCDGESYEHLPDEASDWIRYSYIFSFYRYALEIKEPDRGSFNGDFEDFFDSWAKWLFSGQLNDAPGTVYSEEPRVINNIMPTKRECISILSETYEKNPSFAEAIDSYYRRGGSDEGNGGLESIDRPDTIGSNERDGQTSLQSYSGDGYDK